MIDTTFGDGSGRSGEAVRPYLETTRYAVAEIIVSEDQLHHIRMEAGQPDMTLREAAVWMTDYLFPDRSFPKPWPGELAEQFGKKVKTTQGTEHGGPPAFESGDSRRFDTWIERRKRSTDDT